MALKDVIKEARLKKYLKQEEAAKLVKVTVQTYSKWENGKTEPKASQVAKMSKILGISTDEICYGKKSQKVEFMDFMKMITNQSNNLSNIELMLAIWETVDDDFKFLEKLDRYSEEDEAYMKRMYKKQLEGDVLPEMNNTK